MAKLLVETLQYQILNIAFDSIYLLNSSGLLHICVIQYLSLYAIVMVILPYKSSVSIYCIWPVVVVAVIFIYLSTTYIFNLYNHIQQ